MDVIRLIRWAMVNSIKSNFWPEARRLELLFIEQTVCFAKFLPDRDLIQGWGARSTRTYDGTSLLRFQLSALHALVATKEDRCQCTLHEHTINRLQPRTLFHEHLLQGLALEVGELRERGLECLGIGGTQPPYGLPHKGGQVDGVDRVVLPALQFFRIAVLAEQVAVQVVVVVPQVALQQTWRGRG